MLHKNAQQQYLSLSYKITKSNSQSF